ncbi:hypothetical protein [Eubacterium sp.]
MHELGLVCRVVKTFVPDCPICSSDNLKIVSGRQFDIKEIVAK